MQATFTFASSLVVEPDESIALRSHARKTKTPEFAKRRSSKATPTQPHFKWPHGIGDDLDFAPQNCDRVVNFLHGKSGAEEVLRFRDRHQSARKSTPTRNTSRSDCFARGPMFVIYLVSSVAEQCKRLQILSQHCGSRAHRQLFGI
jgi:hypothetical protein